MGKNSIRNEKVRPINIKDWGTISDLLRCANNKEYQFIELVEDWKFSRAFF